MTDKSILLWYVLDSNGKITSATYKIDSSISDRNFIEYLYGQLKTLPYSGETLENILKETKEYLETTGK